VSLEQVLREVLREVERDTDGRDIAWQVGELPTVHGDRAMLRIALGNLVANAAKFTRTRPRAEIEIGAQNGKPDEVVVFVRDNGVGFDMKYVGKLFGVFQRLHRPESFEGTGIASRRCSASSRATAGACGPKARSTAAPLSISRCRNSRGEAMNGLGRILLVEDDPKDVELTLTALEEYNLANEVVVVRDGEEALDYLHCRGNYRSRAKENPAVMLLDLKLPKVDGLEVLKQIKSDEQLKLIPVVVLTSSHEEQDMMRSYTLGVNAYVVKPVDFHEFVNAVKELGVFWAVINQPPPGSVKR
jgi:CheY-like chemotaxis protein